MLQIIEPSSEFVTAIRGGMKSRYDMIERGDPSVSQDSADTLTQNEQHLAALLNLAFWVSIAREETRHVTGTICVCTPEPYALPIQFADCVPLSHSNLVELLLAAGSSSLAVHYGERGLEASGFLVRSPYHRLNIRVANEGKLIAIYNGNILAALTEGKVIIPRDKLPQNTLASLVADMLDKKVGFDERLPHAFRLLRLVSNINQFGHGGTLIVTAVTNQEWAKDVDIHFKLNDEGSKKLNESMKETFAAQIEAHKSYTSILRNDQTANPALIDMLRIDSAKALQDQTAKLIFKVSELSAIDGAVIVDESFVVHGFGAMLRAKPPEFRVDRYNFLSGVKESAIALNEIGGTRHQSAAQFVQIHHDAMAFVISQDGAVTLLVWAQKEKTVVAFTGIEHLLWEF